MKTAPEQGIAERLLECEPGDAGRLRALCETVTDWGGILESDENQSVRGILYQLLSDAGIDLPTAVKERVARRLALEWLSLLRIRAALDEALATLDAAGVRAVALKGPVLAERLYADPAVRPCSDIDLLVSLTDLDRAAEALRAIGYSHQTGVLDRYYRENHHHLIFYRPAGVPLELHFRATVGFGTAIPAEDLIERARLHERAPSPPAWVLEPEDEALYLLLHAARHLFLDLIWLYDLKLFFGRYPDLDWPLIAERARSLRVVSPLALALEALERRLGVRVPGRRYFAPRHRLLAALAWLTLAVTVKQEHGSGRELAGMKLFRALLCDQPATSAWGFRRRLGRFVRRRVQRYLPGLAPARWAG